MKPPKTVFVLGEEVIGGDPETTLFRGAAAPNVAVAGALREWRRHVAGPACRAGVRWWRMALLSAFSAPLLKAADQPSFGIHGLDASSGGKTCGLRIAASVFGPSRFLSSWNSTAGAIEAAAASSTDLVLALDEIG